MFLHWEIQREQELKELQQSCFSKIFDELEKKKDSVKGKIVFYNYKFNPTFVNTFQSYGDAVRYQGSWSQPCSKIWSVGRDRKKYES